MSIQIIDNFQINVARPIDSRIVASGSVARDAIPYKYEGIRVFDTSNGTSYVWYNGSWTGENASSISGSGTVNYLSKYTTSNTLGNSVIFESSNNILIGTTTNNSPNAKLQVAGIIRSVSGGFYGDGLNITNISASNISTGSLNLARLQTNGSVGFIMARGTTQPTFIDPLTITVNRSNEVRLTSDTTASLRYFVFYDGSTISTGNEYKALSSNTSKPLSLQPSTGFIGINLTSIPTTQLDINGQIRIRGGSPGTGNLLVSDANGLATWSAQSLVSVPVGAIIMWGGTLAGIPTNWRLCDGAFAPLTSLLYAQLVSQGNPFGGAGKLPDLRERFIVGAGGANTTNVVGGSGYSVANFGGLNSVTLTKAQIPKHKHTIGDGVDGGTFSNSGNHQHTYPMKDDDNNNDDNSSFPETGKHDGGDMTGTTSGAGDHRHTGNTGDGTTDGLSGQSHENRPPFFALCFIIKIN